jgi:2,4-dienoyl-CoA reductase (NADPH2)
VSPAGFPHLLSPGRIGPLELRNRIVLAPMGTYLGGEDGHITERHQRFYEERARGGVGLVTTEVVAVDWPRGAAMTHQLGLSDERFVPGLQDLTRRVHAHGAKISVQLQHAGKIAVKDLAEGRPLSVPSAGARFDAGMQDLTAGEKAAMARNISRVDPRNLFRVLDEDEILRIVECFASAALRARQAGFDAVEIHAGHGYLVNEFLSCHTNQRTDRWGGSLENRARLLVEILRRTRERVGPDFAVWCRLDGEEKDIPDGITREDATLTARMAAAAGADAIHVTRYGGGSGIGFSHMIVHERGELLPYAAAIRRAAKLPVIAVGRLDPETAERALAEGHCDFVAMARQLLADPELPNKLAAGRRSDVRPCVHCYVCVGQIFVNESVKCAVNPACAREVDHELTPAPGPRRVLVAGGGPAGMEAARIAALRGHTVALCEKTGHLGGTAFFSSVVYEPNGELVRWQERQLRAAEVEVRLRTEVTPELVRELGAEVVVVATGARREASKLPGADRPEVLSGDALRELLGGGPAAARRLPLGERLLIRAGQALLDLGERPDRVREWSRRWMPLGRRIAIVGGGLVGLELAEFLCERGRRVTVLEEGVDLGAQMAIPRRWRTLHVLREHGVALETGVRVLGFSDRGVEWVAASGEERQLAADAVLLATGVVPDRSLANALEALGIEVHIVGDAGEVGYLEGAVHSGARVGLAV